MQLFEDTTRARFDRPSFRKQKHTRMAVPETLVPFLKPLRSVVDRVPPFARAYRTVRDRIAFHRSRPVLTPHGFLLAGNVEMQRGEFEPIETRVIARLLDKVEAFVDIGANVGYYTCLAAHRGHSVVAVEPSRVNLRYLEANLRANGFENVEILRRGLAASDGSAELFGSGGGASMIRGWKPGVTQPSETIPLTTLDRVLESRFEDQRILVKVDIEGAEHAALTGAVATLERLLAPIWFVEIYRETSFGRRNTAFEATFDLFFDRGYAASAVLEPLVPLARADVAKWRDGREQPLTANFLFTKDS